MAQRSAAGRPGDVEAVADELYGLPLDEFTATRNEHAKRARAGGDGPAAKAISQLAKPNKVAWLANQLVRQHRDEIRSLLELGDSMRQATASLDAVALREASRQQHQIVYGLVRQAGRLANAAGQAMSDSIARGLADTLHAALADEQAARQLTQGRLTSGLTRTGFPGIDASAGPSTARPVAQRKRAHPGRPAAPGATAAHRDQLKRARRDEDGARRHAASAARTLQNAQAALTHARDAARDAADHVSRLRTALDEALEAQVSAGRAQRRARAEADRAERAVRHADRRLQDATARREELE